MRTNGRILHVIESFGGGSANAMRQFARSTPDHEHYLLRALRPGEYVENESLPEFVKVLELPEGAVSRIRAIRRAIRTLQPSVVHAHSSFAGALVRVASRSKSTCRVVYSPHCFAFERKDVPAVIRATYFALELILALNTDVLAACSRRETSIGARMRAYRKVVYVPNVASASRETPREPGTRFVVVGLGRISAQKDPGFFSRVVAALRADDSEVEARWIGDGSPYEKQVLAAAGVRVTGWVDAESVESELASASVYVHTARWEGFPLSVLEASALAVPVVARHISAFEGCPDRWLISDSEGLARAARKAYLMPNENVRDWRSALEENTVAVQQERLLQIYAEAYRG